MQPLVSIIIPVFNTGKTALKLAQSLIKDTYKNLEIILIDDGSEDDSLNVLKTLTDKRIHLYHQDNSGPSSARNLGIEKSSGKYLLFIDSDDTVSPDFISEMVKTIELSNTAIAVTGFKYHHVKTNMTEIVHTNELAPQKANESFKSYIMRLLYSDGRMYAAFNKIFIAKVIKDHHIKFDAKMSYGEDTKFVLDYLSHADGIIRFILKPLYTYNSGTETSIASKGSAKWSNWKACYNNLKKWVGKHPSTQEKIRLYRVYWHWHKSCLGAKLRLHI